MADIDPRNVAYCFKKNVLCYSKTNKQRNIVAASGLCYFVTTENNYCG